MTERYIYNKKIRNAPIRRRLDHRFVSWVMVAALVGSVVASGFVYSARCQVEAMTLGYETQQRRTELEQIAEQQRALELERERECAPAQLEKRALKIGLKTPDPPESTKAEDGEKQ